MILFVIKYGFLELKTIFFLTQIFAIVILSQLLFLYFIK